MKRLFVAIWLPEEVLSALPLPLLQERLTRQGVRFTRREKIHLTLRFLGNVADEEIEALVQSLASNLAGVAAQQLSMSGVGAFPNLARPGIVWLGVSGDLSATYERVVEATDDFAEKPETKPYHPHLTVARVSPPSQKVGRALQPLVEQLGDEVFATFTSKEVALVESRGGVYESLASFPLT